jgi:hypothetical protein
MDTIIENLVKKFSEEHGFADRGVEDQFERFSNYCVVATRGTEESFDVEDVTVDGSEVGIDGLAIQVNGRIVTDPDEVAGLAQTNGWLEVNFIFVQAKTSENFDSGAVEKMARAIKDFWGSRHRCGQGERQKALLSRALPDSRSPRTLRTGR